MHPPNSYKLDDLLGLKARSSPENFNNTKHLYQDPDKLHRPYLPRQEYPEIKFNSEVYKHVLNGGFVKVPEHKTHYAGRVFRVVNLDNGSYITRRLDVIGDRGCFTKIY